MVRMASTLMAHPKGYEPDKPTKPDPKPQVEKPEKADKPKKRVRVVRDADGAITHFEAD